MTIGENIKFYRTKANLTQKDLSDLLNVTFQTVSKWENNTNEPDLSTLKSMCEIFKCTMDDLTNYDDVQEQKIEEKPLEQSTSNIEVTVKEEKKDNEVINKQENKKNKIKQNKKHHTPTKFEFDRDNKKAFIWGLIIGILALIGTLIGCISDYTNVGLGWTIGGPLLACYIVLSFIYCIFSFTWVSDVFTEVASWSIKFPGIIFEFSLDGLEFLIVMKILFWLIGVVVGILTFILALILSIICSIFTFPFALIFDNRG